MLCHWQLNRRVSGSTRLGDLLHQHFLFLSQELIIHLLLLSELHNITLPSLRLQWCLLWLLWLCCILSNWVCRILLSLKARWCISASWFALGNHIRLLHESITLWDHWLGSLIVGKERRVFLHFAFDCLLSEISVIALRLKGILAVLLLNLCKILGCLPGLLIVEVQVRLLNNLCFVRNH